MPVTLSFSYKNLMPHERSMVSEYIETKVPRIKKLEGGDSSLTVRVEKFSKKAAYKVELFLKVPHGRSIQASEDDHTLREAIDFAIDKLLRQLEKTHEMKKPSHHRYPRGKSIREQWFEVEEQIRAPLKDGSLERKEFFRAIEPLVPPVISMVRHELAHINALQEIREEVSPEEIVDDAVLALWEGRGKQPRVMTLQQWFYRVALGKLSERIKSERYDAPPISLEEMAVRQGDTPQAFDLGDEVKDFWQPDALLTIADTIKIGEGNKGLAPSQKKLYRLLLRALIFLKASMRQAFLLHFREGFSPDEIAQIQKRTTAAVEKDIKDAVVLLRRRVKGMNM